MEAAIITAAAYTRGAMSLAVSAIGLKARLELSKAKHRSLAGHARIARLVSTLVQFYQYDEAQTFKADAAPDVVVAQRGADFTRLADLYRKRYAGTLQLTAETTGLISDLQFTEAYRVPFQFSRHVRRHLPVGAFLQSSSGVTTADLAGNSFYELTGSYGVNLFGYDFYKDCIDRGIERVHALGPVLGSYHPLGRRQCRAPRAPVGHGRGFVPYVRNRGRHAGGQARALPYEALPPGALLRFVSRLV